MKEDANAIRKVTASSGKGNYTDAITIRNNSNGEIKLVTYYVPRSNGTEEVKFKLERWLKIKGKVVFKLEQSTPWLQGKEIELIIEKLKLLCRLSDEDIGHYLLIKTGDSTIDYGGHDPSQVLHALIKVMSDSNFLNSCESSNISEELVSIFYTGIKIRRMRRAIEELKNHLDNGHVAESIYQDWCNTHSWIFGNAYVMRDEQHSISAGDKADILLPNVISGYRDLIELKRPNMPVIQFDSSHKSYYHSSEASKAIGQCHRYLDVFHEDGANGLRDHEHIIAYHPRATIVIGRSHDWEDKKKKALHGLNSRFNNITIMTYDCLLTQGKRLLQIMEADSEFTIDH